MTPFNIRIEDKTYEIHLSPQACVSTTRNMMALYHDYRTANPSKANVSFDEYLDIVSKQPHPENQVMEIVDEADEDDAEFIEMNDMLMQLRVHCLRKDAMIEALCDAIKAMR